MPSTGESCMAPHLGGRYTTIEGRRRVHEVDGNSSVRKEKIQKSSREASEMFATEATTSYTNEVAALARDYVNICKVFDHGAAHKPSA